MVALADRSRSVSQRVPASIMARRHALDGWSRSLRTWNEVVKRELVDLGECTIAHGPEPSHSQES
jgi:hypothetical protein